MNTLKRIFLRLNTLGYPVIRPLFFRKSAQDMHESLLIFLSYADQSTILCTVADIVRSFSQFKRHIKIGDVTLTQPHILAAGFVKGHGFVNEKSALAAVHAGENIIPGWKSIPKLVGLVEFGSFTRQPRMGNPGTVLWRDPQTRSTQNRIGLKNPGAIAAAEFLEVNILDLPVQFGINIAVSPGVDDEQAVIDVEESIDAFLRRSIVPNWFTLNISCPNTEDDPSGNQTEERTRRLCEAALSQIERNRYRVPLWVKISPGLAEMQYKILMKVFAEVGIQAVISTNTIGQPSPEDPQVQAGVGGGRLLDHALNTTRLVQEEINTQQYPIAVIGCGGITDGTSYRQYTEQGIEVFQYWSALIYRGPLAGSIIESEL